METEDKILIANQIEQLESWGIDVSEKDIIKVLEDFNQFAKSKTNLAS